MLDFLIIFGRMEESVFQTLHDLKYQLDIGLKGKYNISVAFSETEKNTLKKYKVLGTPALINLTTGQVIYGHFKDKSFLQEVLSAH